MDPWPHPPLAPVGLIFVIIVEIVIVILMEHASNTDQQIKKQFPDPESGPESRNIVEGWEIAGAFFSGGKSESTSLFFCMK